MDDFDLGLGLGGRRKSISAKMPGAMNLVLIVIVMLQPVKQEHIMEGDDS